MHSFKTWNRRLVGAMLAVTVTRAALAFGPPPAPTASNPIVVAQATDPAAAPAAAAPADLERQGAELFGRNCQLCHNSRGKGGKGPQLVKGAWGPGGANSDEFMFNTIKNGRPNTQMGGFGGALSDDEIRVIVAFLRAESVRVKAAERKAADAEYVPW